MSLYRLLGAPLAVGFLGFVALAPQGCGECDAAPVCGDDEIEVDSCDGQPDCDESETCGNVVYCVPAAQCEAYPTCDADQKEVQTCPSGVTCEEVTLCGSTILCAPTGPCMTADDCGLNQFCDFRDGECGAGGAGECKEVPSVCTDGPPVCFCDGTLTADGDFGCEGWSRRDLDSTGTACTLPPTAFSCGHLVCDYGTDDYCHYTADDTGGAPYVSCSIAPTGCDPASCACLTAEMDACDGKCADGPNGPTITCPGG
jgi:hypothetical protein